MTDIGQFSKVVPACDFTKLNGGSKGQLISRVYFTSGSQTYNPPQLAHYMRAVLLSAGGGPSSGTLVANTNGGGSAFSITYSPVFQSDTLVYTVGLYDATGSNPGLKTSSVTRNGVVISQADPGQDIASGVSGAGGQTGIGTLVIPCDSGPYAGYSPSTGYYGYADENTPYEVGLDGRLYGVGCQVTSAGTLIAGKSGIICLEFFTADPR